MDGLYYFIDLMQKGKAVNYVILLLYLVVLATAAERLVYYISTQYKRKLFYSILKECEAAFLHKQVITQAAFQKKGLHNSCIESVGQVFFEYRSTQSGALAEAFERTVQGIIAVQDRGFNGSVSEDCRFRRQRRYYGFIRRYLGSDDYDCNRTGNCNLFICCV